MQIAVAFVGSTSFAGVGNVVDGVGAGAPLVGSVGVVVVAAAVWGDRCCQLLVALGARPLFVGAPRRALDLDLDLVFLLLVVELQLVLLLSRPHPLRLYNHNNDNDAFLPCPNPFVGPLFLCHSVSKGIGRVHHSEAWLPLANLNIPRKIFPRYLVAVARVTGMADCFVLRRLESQFG